MHKFVHGCVVVLLLACGTAHTGGSSSDQPALHYRSDWARAFVDSGSTGVFVLWEPDSFRLQTSDTVRMDSGFLPASTFKIFNSLVALQTGAVADEHTVIPWDGVKRRPTWDTAMDMAQAIQVSCVPWYQEVARRAGKERMQHWLDTARYGNQVMGDSIDMFWLTGALRITPVQQVYFVQQLNEERLPFHVEHQRTVKRIMPGDSTANWRLRGKTGWAIRVKDNYAWYVGWVERGGRTAYFATQLDIRNEETDLRKRQNLTRALLMKEGWLDNEGR